MKRIPRVWNKRDRRTPSDAVYVGRPSKWGNPYSHMAGTLAKYHVDTRAEAISKYREWLLSQPDLLEQVKQELAGKDLVCWCAPHECHGDVLLELANPEVVKPKRKVIERSLFDIEEE